MNGYISELRKVIGNRTIIQCAASIICVDKEGRILLGKRSDNHKYGYSGGSVEIDEKVEDCAIRELYEEMGLIAEELEFFFINSGPEAHYIYPNGDEVSNIEIVYLCRKFHGEIKDSDEMTDMRFFKAEDIDMDMISPPIRKVIVKYIEYTKKEVSE